MLEQPSILLFFLAFIFKSAGLLMREELRLRALLLIGIGFDIAFFLMVSGDGIASSVLANSLLFLVNLGVLCVIVLERSTWFMSQNELTAFQNFKTLTPGQFRQIMRAARWTVAPQDTVLLHEGEMAEKLFFLEAKSFTITKKGESYETQGPAFVGEISLLQGGSASADVTVPQGAIYAEWRSDTLRRMMKTSRALDNALVARFGHELADKLRNSVPMRQS